MWNNVDSRFNRNMKRKNTRKEHCLFLIVVALFCLISPCTPIISDKRLCYDPDCSVAIGSAKTLSNYHSNDPQILSFHVNEDVEIFSKGAGLRKDLWGVEIAGKRGYAPSMFLVEKKTIHKILTHEVPTPEYESPVPVLLPHVHDIDGINVDGSGFDGGITENKEEPPNESTIDPLQPIPQQVSPSFEVIDGTTFNFPPKEEIRNDNNYATEIMHGTAPIPEGPFLTVHPNPESNGIIPQEHTPTDAVVTPSEVSDQSRVQSVFVPTSSEKSNGETPDSEKHRHIRENEQAVHPSEHESTVVNAIWNIPLENNENAAIPSERIVPDQVPLLNDRLDSEQTNIITSQIDGLSRDAPDHQVPTEDGSASIVNIQDRDLTEKSFHMIQSKQLSLDVNEGNVQMITKLYDNTLHDSATDTLARVSDTLSAFNAETLVTTDISTTPYDMSASTEASDSGMAGIVNDKYIKIENRRETSEAEMLNELVHRDELNHDATDDSSYTISDNISEDNATIFDNIPEGFSRSMDNEFPSQPGQLNIHGNIESSESTVEIHSDHLPNFDEFSVDRNLLNVKDVISEDVCYHDDDCKNNSGAEEVTEEVGDDSEIMNDNTEMHYTNEHSQNYWETFSYLALTAFTTLLFSLGYYYIENARRDGQLIAKINKLEKELLISSKECTVLDESLKSTKTKLNSIEDQSFGSNEMVVSLKAELETAYTAKRELEDQVTALEKDLESATEAGLELERMLREILASNNTENSLAKSVEDLQIQLNTQHAANVSLTTAMHQKTQENEALTDKLTSSLEKNETLEIEVARINDELKQMIETKSDLEQSLLNKIARLENQVKNVSADRVTLRKQLKGKEMEISDLIEVVKQSNTSGIDIEKLSNVSRVKADAKQLLDEKEELQSKLSELEGAHHLLEEHMKIINEEMKSLGNQCRIAEKEKNDAETRLQVLSKFFKEKEEERQKEEAAWLQQQGEVSMNHERLLTVNNEIQSYKQQIEILKREILDQEREYKNQITNLESKSHEQWVLARQNERRLEEAKAEASQLRNRLTLIEKNISDNDSDVKTHRMETNGETATSPSLFIGAEASSSPIIFSGSSNIPPPYLYGPPLPPFLPPHLHSSSTMHVGFDVGQRPPPLGGRLSSPPPVPIATGGPPPPLPPTLHPSSGGRYENVRSSPSPPLSPSILPPYGHFRSHLPPPLPFPNDRVHPPPPVHMGTMLPPHLSSTSWGEEKISSRNNSSFHSFHRDQQSRDYTGSLVSSDESLDKTHSSGKV